jgi:hypothetical protein
MDEVAIDPILIACMDEKLRDCDKTARKDRKIYF